MDSSQPPKPTHLLDDLESIRQLLEKDQLEPPLLTEALDHELDIPLLSDIIEPAPAAPAPNVQLPYPVRPAVVPAAEPSTAQSISGQLDAELRAAAQLILQDVIDDFVPQIEAELRRRLEARLDRLSKPGKA